MDGVNSANAVMLRSPTPILPSFYRYLIDAASKPKTKQGHSWPASWYSRDAVECTKEVNALQIMHSGIVGLELGNYSAVLNDVGNHYVKLETLHGGARDIYKVSYP